MKAAHFAGEMRNYSISGLFSISTGDTISLYVSASAVTTINGDNGNLSVIG